MKSLRAASFWGRCWRGALPLSPGREDFFGGVVELLAVTATVSHVPRDVLFLVLTVKFMSDKYLRPSANQTDSESPKGGPERSNCRCA